MKRWLAVVAWIALIFLTSSTVVTTKQLAGAVSKVTPTPASEFETFWRTIWWIPVKGWHVTEFALLFTFIYWASRRKPLAAAISLGYAFFDEFHQVFVASRGGRLSDVLIDALGIVLAWQISANLERPKPERASGWKWLIGLVIGCAAVYLLAHFPFGGLPSVGFARGGSE